MEDKQRSLTTRVFVLTTAEAEKHGERIRPIVTHPECGKGVGLYASNNKGDVLDIVEKSPLVFSMDLMDSEAHHMLDSLIEFMWNRVRPLGFAPRQLVNEAYDSISKEITKETVHGAENFEQEINEFEKWLNDPENRRKEG